MIDMQKITKKEFRQILVEKDSKLFMIDDKPRKEFLDLQDFVIDNLDALKEGTRSARAGSTGLVFSDGSSLYTRNNKYVSYQAYIYRFSCCSVLAFEGKWYDSFNDDYRYKTIYYAI